MTYFVCAFTNDQAELCVHRMQTNDKMAAAIVLSHWENQGYKVKAWEEG